MGKRLLRLQAIPLLAMLCGCIGTDDRLDLSMYQYRETRDLVRFVHEAACRIETEGSAAIDFFRENPDGCCRGDQYLYVYDMNANSVFHAGMPYLEGTNLREITDVEGKRIFDMVFQALADSLNPHAWVHYSWYEPGAFYPVPKSSCHFRVTTPEGGDLIVGGGINYPHEEREFARIAVDGAVALIEKIGPAAIDSISDPRSHFSYRDVRVFAFMDDGSIVISPITADSSLQIGILDAEDRAGNRPFALAVSQLESSDVAWQVFLARNRYERQLVKKVLYLRKTELGSGTLYVGAITDLPMTP